MLYAELDAEVAIADFQVACAHLESLHLAYVVVINKARWGLTGQFDDFGLIR